MSTLSPPLKKNDAESFLKELIDSCKENGFSQLRKTGTENFLKAGLPGRKEEAYKYAPLTSVLNNLGTGKPQSAASPGDALTYLFKDFASGNALSVFLLNGTIIKVPENLPKGLSIVPLEETSPYAKNTGRLSTASSDPLCQLNNSIFSSGLVIHIAKGSSIEKPIVVFNLISSDSPALISSRLLIVAEENTRAGIIEFSDTLRQNHKILSNEVQETFVGKNATLFHYRWQSIINYRKLGKKVFTTP
jgi:Fe-S cluster assembly protein SufD